MRCFCDDCGQFFYADPYWDGSPSRCSRCDYAAEEREAEEREAEKREAEEREAEEREAEERVAYVNG